MPAPHDESRTERARAREALTRIALRRRLELRALVRDALAGAALLLPVVVVLLGAAVWTALGFDPQSFALIALVLPLVFVAYLAGMGVEMFLAVLLCCLVFLCPWWIYRGWRWLRVWRRRREAEGVLAAEGRVSGDWARTSAAHDAALDELARADEGLVRTKGDALRPEREGPPESCPDCGADLAVVGEGLRRCAHCDYERYEELPARPEALGRARKVIAGVRQGVPLMTWRQRWRAFLAGSRGLKHRRRRKRIVLEYGAGVAMGALLDLLDHGLGLTGPMPGIPVGILMVGVEMVLAVELLFAVYEYYNLRFAQFGPGSLAYDVALYDELIRALAFKGRARVDDLARHLGVSRDHLEQVLASLSRFGQAPLYRDRQRDELLSLHAREAGSNDCPACGGELEVAPGARMTCTHCGAEALGTAPTY